MQGESDATTGNDGPPTTEDLVRRGAELDGVELVEYEPRNRKPLSGPVRRSRRAVLFWWAVTALSSLAAIGVFLFWPWRYVPPGESGHTLYVLYTPILGLFLGLAVLGLSMALVLTAKRLLPREVAVEQRHLEDGSSQRDRETFAAAVRDAGQQSGLKRRSVFGRAAVAGTGLAGMSLGVVGLGAFVRDPWDRESQTKNPEDTLWHTGWHSPDGETVFLRRETSDPTAVELVRPQDLEPGASLTVFPFRESQRDNPEELAKTFEQADDPATLYRLLPGSHVAVRPDRAGMHYRDYFAFSRLCTHLGCPVGMYKDQERVAMCPCHQSQFDLTEYARPVFGPATRPLPQLPIALGEGGYFIALSDFTGPVGPAFWELGR